MVGLEIQSHYDGKGWLTKLNARTIEYKGTVTEIIFHKENMLISPIEKGIEAYVHFIIANDTLSRITTQYANLTFQELKQLMVMNRRINMSDYFFTPDYSSYHHIYVAADGMATDDFRKTRRDQLSPGVLEQLHMIANKW